MAGLTRLGYAILWPIIVLETNEILPAAADFRGGERLNSLTQVKNFAQLAPSRGEHLVAGPALCKHIRVIFQEYQ
jgi:hypothetical protein